MIYWLAVELLRMNDKTVRFSDENIGVHVIITGNSGEGWTTCIHIKKFVLVRVTRSKF